MEFQQNNVYNLQSFHNSRNFTDRVPFVNQHNFQSADGFEMYRGKPNNWNYQGNGYDRQDEFYVSNNYQGNHHQTHHGNSNYRYRYENSRTYSHSRNHHQIKSTRRKYHYNDIYEPNIDSDEEYNRPYHKNSSPRSRRHDSYLNNKIIYPTETIPKHLDVTKKENDAKPTIRDESKCSNKVNINTSNKEIIINESKCCNNNIEDKSTVGGNKKSDQVVPKTESLAVILKKTDFFVQEDDDDQKGSEGKNTFDDKLTELPVQESTISYILTNENDTKDKINTEEKVITNSLVTTPIKEIQQEEEEEEVDIELELQRLCNDPITINDINQSGSYLDCFPLMDDYRVVDMDLGSPVTANKEQSKVTLSTDDLLEELDDAIKSNESNKTPTASNTPSTPRKRKHLDHRRMSVESKVSKRINDDEVKSKGNKINAVCEQTSKVAKRRKSCVEDNSHGRKSTNDVCRRSSLFSEPDGSESSAASCDTPTKDWKSIYFPSLRSDYTIPKASKSKPVFSQPDTPCCKPIHILFNNDKVEESSSKIAGNKVVEKEKSSKIVNLKEKCPKEDSKQTITKRQNEKVDKSSKVAEMVRSPKVGARKKDNGGSELRKKMQKIFCVRTKNLPTVKSSENVHINKIEPKTTEGTQEKPKAKLSEVKKSRFSEDEKDEKRNVGGSSKSTNTKKVSESDRHKTHKSKVQSESKQNPKKKLKAMETKKVSPKHVSTDKNLCNSVTEHITDLAHSEKVGVEINASKGVQEKNKKCCKKLNVFDIKNFVIENSPNDINQNNKVVEDVTDKNKKGCKKLTVSNLKISLIRKNFNKQLNKIFDDNVESKDTVDKDCGDDLDTSMKDVGSNDGIEQDSNVKKDNIIETMKEFQKLDDGLGDINKNENIGSQENQELNLQDNCLIKEFGCNENSAKEDKIIEGVKESQKLDDGMVDTSKNEITGFQDNEELNLQDNSLVEKFEGDENNAKQDNIIEGVKEFQKLDDGIGDTSKNETTRSQENEELNLQDNSLVEKFECNENNAKQDNIIEGVKEFQKLDDGIGDTSKNAITGSQENEELNLQDNSSIEEFEGNEISAKKDNIIEVVNELQKLNDGLGNNSIEEDLERNGSVNCIHELFDLKDISCEKTEPNTADQKLKILSDLEDTSIQLVEFESPSPSIIIDLTSPEVDHEEESDLKIFESAYARTQLSIKDEIVEDIQTVEEKTCNSSQIASTVEHNEFGNVCKKLEEIFSLFNPNLNSRDGSNDLNKNAITKVTEESVKCIKTERKNDECFKEPLIVIKTPFKVEIQENVETCKNFMIHQYPTLQKLIPIPIEINCSEKASTTESPVVGTVEIVKQSQKIVQDIEIIDLTNETVDRVESNLCQVFDESTEKITLYRSDETSTGSPDVLAMSASLSPSVVLNKNAFKEVKSEVEHSKKEQDLNKSDENLTLKQLLYPSANNTVTTDRTVTATKPDQMTSYAATSSTTPSSYSHVTRNDEIPAISSNGVYQIRFNPTGIVNIQQSSFAQDLRSVVEDKRKSTEQRGPAPAATTRTGQFYENAPSKMMQYKERDRQPVKEASTRRQKSNSQQRNTDHAAMIPKTSQPPPPPYPYISLSEWQKCLAEYIWLIIHKNHVDEKDLTWIKSKNLTPSIYAKELKIVEKTSEIRLTVYAKDMATRLHFMNIGDRSITPVHIVSIYEYLKQIQLPVTLLQTYAALWKLIGPYHDYYSSHLILRTLYKVVYEVIKAIITKSDMNKSSKSTLADLFTSNQRDQLLCQIHFYNTLTKRLRPEISASTMSRPVYYASNDTYNKETPKKPVLHKSKQQNIFTNKSAASVVKNNQPQQTTSVPAGRSYPSNQYDQLIYQRINGAVADNKAACGKQNQIPDQTNFTSNAASYQRQFLNKPYMRPNYSVQRPSSNTEYARVPGENSTAPLPGGNSSMFVNYPQGLDNVPTFKVPSKSNLNLRKKTAENNLPESTSSYVDTTDKTSSSSPYGPSILIPKASPDTAESGSCTGRFLANETSQIISTNQPISTDKAVFKNSPTHEIVSETITRNVDVDASNVVPEEEVIDLTWLDDFKTEELEEAVECIIKKEEPTCEEDEVILNQEQFPVAYSPSDSGVEGSPSPQRDVNDLVFVGRYCICDKPAEYICGCRMAMYCSNNCQNEDWVEHKKICLRVMKEYSVL